MDAVHIMLMENTLRLKNPDRLNYIFDLKGSRVARKVKGVTKASTTLKDINFEMAAKINRNLTAQSSANKRLLRAAIRKDVEFLQSQCLMDYSLLLGIETLDKRPEPDCIEMLHQIEATPIKNQSGEARSSVNIDEAEEMPDVGELIS